MMKFSWKDFPISIYHDYVRKSHHNVQSFFNEFTLLLKFNALSLLSHSSRYTSIYTCVQMKHYVNHVHLTLLNVCKPSIFHQKLSATKWMNAFDMLSSHVINSFDFWKCFLFLFFFCIISARSLRSRELSDVIRYEYISDRNKRSLFFFHNAYK